MLLVLLGMASVVRARGRADAEPDPMVTVSPEAVAPEARRLAVAGRQGEAARPVAARTGLSGPEALAYVSSLLCPAVSARDEAVGRCAVRGTCTGFPLRRS